MAVQTGVRPCARQNPCGAVVKGNLCNLRVESLNCRGLCERAKRTAIFDFLKGSSLTIIFLQETKLSHLKAQIMRENGIMILFFLIQFKVGVVGLVFFSIH